MQTDYKAAIILGILVAGAITAYALGAKELAIALAGMIGGQVALKQPFTMAPKEEENQ